MIPMILARSGLRRSRTIARRLVFGLVLALSPALAVLCSNLDREAAKTAWAEAERLNAALGKTPEPSRESYLKCIRTYQQVYLQDPHFGYSPDAVFEAAQLYQTMGEKFGNSSYFKNAAKLYRFLTTDYGLSLRCPEALLRLGTISEGPLHDEQSALDAYQKLRTRYKSSAAAATLAARSQDTETAKPVPLSVPAPAVFSKPPAAQIDAPAPKAGASASIKSINILPSRDHTRVSIVSDGPIRYTKSSLSNPDRVYFDIKDVQLDRSLLNKIFNVDDKFLKQIRIAQFQPDLARIVLDLIGAGDVLSSEQSETFGITVDLHFKDFVPAPAAAPKSPVVPPPAKEKPSLLAPVASAEIKTPEPALPKPKPDAGSQTAVPNAASGLKSAAESKLAAPKTALPEKSVKDIQGGGAASTSVAAKETTSSPVAAPAKEPARATSTSPAIVSVEPPSAPKTAQPTSHGDRTLTRILGLKIGRIVLDPGHGGRDTGTVGPGGIMEKDLVLGVSKELQKLLQDKLGAQVILTRTDDSYVSLEDRPLIANQQQADLFVSIHANSSVIRSVSGVETYFLDFARTDSAREVSARENASSDRNIRDLQDLILKIAQADKLQESRELASIIQKNLFDGAHKLIPTTMNRGVRSAPFIVLIGAHMPSILAEISFLSNPRDEKILMKDTNRQSLAVSLFQGIEAYMKSLGSAVAINHSHKN
jgi:N-acetylmuramoyl-L-alanine amidase